MARGSENPPVPPHERLLGLRLPHGPLLASHHPARLKYARATKTIGKVKTKETHLSTACDENLLGVGVRGERGMHQALVVHVLVHFRGLHQAVGD